MGCLERGRLPGSARQAGDGGKGVECTERPRVSWKTEIEGGYVQVRTWEMAAVWTSYAGGLLQALDIRVWLSAMEMATRRAAASVGERSTPRFTLRELQGLVGAGVRAPRLRAALRRLEGLGLVRMRRGTLAFARSLEDVRLADLAPVLRMLELLPPKRGWFPLPRRILRVLAAGVKKGVLATVLGQSAFCLYRNGGAWSEEGSVKASRLAAAFGLSERSIFRAREHLVEVRFLAPVAGQPMWHRKRFGQKYAVNAAWSRELPLRELSPEADLSTGCLSGLPYQAPSLREEKKHQELAQRAEASGVLEGNRKEQEPTWRNIKPEDLRTTERRLGLYASALRAGALLQGEGSKLNFLAACERAFHRGTENPCGLLRWLVERNGCRFVSNDEEETARRALKAFEGRDLGGGGGGTQISQASGLSPDGRFARELTRTLQRRGVFEDPFPHLARMRPEWTRERWERAAEELRELSRPQEVLAVAE